MEFALNGEVQRVDGPLTVGELLERHALRQQRVAVAVNTNVVPRSRFDQVKISEGDRVEVIHAVGGG